MALNVSKEQLSQEFAQIIQNGQYEVADKLLTTLRNSVDVNEYLTVELCVSAAFLYHTLGKRDTEFQYIKAGFTLNHRSSELFMTLADYYSTLNAQQCLICLYQALFYARKQGKAELSEQIKKMIDVLIDKGIEVPKTSFVILSFNTLGYIRQCLDSIKETVPLDRCQIIVVENASTDGSVEYLRSLDWITLVKNKENRGFPGGCNDGIAVAESDNDIYLLNSDTILPLNAVFWVKMGLYENDKIGSTGSLTNYAANGQAVNNDNWKTLDDVISYGINSNVPMDYPYEYKMYLVGFSQLIKRSVLDDVGLLDERFFPGNSEDIDIGLRTLKSGKLNVLCHNSFVFHYGSKSFAELQKQGNDYNTLLTKNNKKLEKKLGFKPWYYMFARAELISEIKADRNANIRVLEVGCGMGGSASLIRTLFPNSEYFGVEYSKEAGAYAKAFGDVTIGDAEKIYYEDIYPDECFDYVIFGDVLEHLHEPAEVLRKIYPCIKNDGHIIVSMPNVKHWSVMLPLLREDRFTYEDAGILDRTHLKMYTGTEINRLITESGFSVEKEMYTQIGQPDEKGLEQLKLLAVIFNIQDLTSFMAYQYVFVARKKNDE